MNKIFRSIALLHATFSICSAMNVEYKNSNIVEKFRILDSDTVIVGLADFLIEIGLSEENANFVYLRCVESAFIREHIVSAFKNLVSVADCNKINELIFDILKIHKSISDKYCDIFELFIKFSSEAFNMSGDLLSLFFEVVSQLSISLEENFSSEIAQLIPDLVQNLYLCDAECRELCISKYFYNCKNIFQLTNKINFYLYVPYIQTFSLMIPHIRNIKQLSLIDDFISYFMKSLNCENCIIDYIPNALKNEIERTGDFDEAISNITCLLQKDISALENIFCIKNANLLPHSACDLAIAMLAQLNSFEFFIQKFFEKVINKINEGNSNLQFNNFVESIFDTLVSNIKNFNNVETYEVLSIALKLLFDVVIPNKFQIIEQENTIQQEIISYLDEIENNQIDIETDSRLADFLENIFVNGISYVPSDLYQQLGLLLISINKKKQLFSNSILAITEFFDCLKNLPFKIKSIFVEPIGYQLIYLHKMFSI